MNIELTEKEFRRLLDLVYVGNWVLNSTRGEDRFEDYDLLHQFDISDDPDENRRMFDMAFWGWGMEI